MSSGHRERILSVSEREQAVVHGLTWVPEELREKITAPACEALNDLLVANRDHREILRAWALGDSDKMAVLMLDAFLREFGKAPEPVDA